MSELRTNRIVPRDGLPSGSAGGIIQVKSVTYTTQDSITNENSFVSKGPSATITPTRSDSKILIQFSVNGQNRTNGLHVLGRLVKTIGGTQSTVQNLGLISYGNSSHDQIEYISGSHLDSPATTSAVTYKMQVGTPYSSSYAVFVNYHQEESDLAWVGRGASSITVMEISG